MSLTAASSVNSTPRLLCMTSGIIQEQERPQFGSGDKPFWVPTAARVSLLQPTSSA